jgi:corrinoid protein of di/trimethylamine methyltransferase
MTIFEDMADAVIRGDEADCIELANRVLNENIDPVEAIQKGFSKGMETVGKKFESGEFYLPQMLLAAKAMDAGVAILEPSIASRDSQEKLKSGTIVLATIQGDQHDIGKNIVKLLLSTSGFYVIDLGKDVKVIRIIEAAQEKKADIIGVSALMTTTMGYMPELIIELTEMNIRQSYKVMVGGAPVTSDWAEEIGFDGYGEDAVAAVRLARELMDEKKPKVKA